MIDQMLAHGVVLPPWVDGADDRPLPLPLDSAPNVVVCDNIANYFFLVSDQEIWNLEKDFPNIAPPFDQCWFEYRPPKFLNSEGIVRRVEPEYEAIGFHSSAQRQPDHGWKLLLTLFMKLRGEKYAHGAFATAEISVSPEGKYIDVEGNGSTPVWIPPKHHHPDPKVLANYVVNALKPVMLTICFMHCKNVSVVPTAPPAAVSKKWERKTGRPLIRYHVLDIEPMKDLLRSTGAERPEVGFKRALHICRGHFATYTDDRPLFGRMTGTFWKAQHLRGTVNAGISLKDYNVKAPKQEA